MKKSSLQHRISEYQKRHGTACESDSDELLAVCFLTDDLITALAIARESLEKYADNNRWDLPSSGYAVFETDAGYHASEAREALDKISQVGGE